MDVFLYVCCVFESERIFYRQQSYFLLLNVQQAVNDLFRLPRAGYS